MCSCYARPFQLASAISHKAEVNAVEGIEAVLRRFETEMTTLRTQGLKDLERRR